MAKMPRSGRWPCKKNTILLLSTTLDPWCHFPRVGSPFLANGCSKSNMGLMVKLNVTRPDCGKKFPPNIWSWLQWNFCTCCKVCVNSLYPCTSSHWRHGDSSNGGQNRISQWWPWKGDIHGTTRRIHTRRWASCVQTTQVIVWVETISKGLEPKIKCFFEKHPICEEWCKF